MADEILLNFLDKKQCDTMNRNFFCIKKSNPGYTSEPLLFDVVHNEYPQCLLVLELPL